MLLLGIKVNGCDDSLIAGVSGGVPIPRLLDGVHATQKERILCMKNESYLIELNLEQMQYLRDLINLRMNDLNYMVDNLQLDGYVKERDLLLDAGKKFSKKLGYPDPVSPFSIT